MDSTISTNSDHQHKLTFVELVLFGLSNIIGSGLFVALQSSLVYGGSMSTIALLLVFISTIITGYVYVELFERYDSSITEYLSVKDNLGVVGGHIITYLLYFFGVLFFTTIVIYITKYLWKSILPNWMTNKLWAQPIMSTIILSFICGLLYEGIQNSRYVSYFIAVLLVMVVVGVIILSFPKYSYSAIFVEPPFPNIDMFVLSSVMSLFLFNGYDFVIKIKDETSDSSYNKKGIIICIVISAILYGLVFASCFSVLKYKGISKLNGDLITRMYSVLENKTISYIVFLIGAVIMFNSSLLTVLSSSSFLTAMGKQNEIPFKDFFENPKNAVIFTGVIGSILSIINKPNEMAVLANILFIIIIIMLSLSLIAIRWKERVDVDKQKKYNYLSWLNFYNIPAEVVLNIGVLCYVLFIIVRDRLWEK